MSRALLGIVLLAGCAARRGATNAGNVEQTPAWATPEGMDRARLDIVQLLLDADNAEGALSMIARLRADGFSDPELDLMQGRALVKLGMLDDARGPLLAVPKRHPIYPAAQNELGMLDLETRELDEAISCFERATRSEASNAGYWNNLGFALLSAGRAEEAVTALRQAVSLDGSSQRTRNNLGYALVATGHDQEAWRMFRSTGAEADARYNLGVGLELRGDIPAATTAYQEALAAAPGHARARDALVRVSTSDAGATAPAGPPSPLESP